MEREITHQRWFDFEDGAGSILLLLSVTGTAGSDTVTDLSALDVGTPDQQLAEQYVLI